MSQAPAKIVVSLLPANTALTILFVLLKVFDKIDWSWWWVFAPMWVPGAVALSLIGFLMGIGLLVALAAAVFK